MTLPGIFAALGGIPALPGARCRGRHHLFDPPTGGENPATTEARHAQALGLCSRCDALDKCRQFFEALPPSKRPLGVIAGQVNPKAAGRPRKAS